MGRRSGQEAALRAPRPPRPSPARPREGLPVPPRTEERRAAGVWFPGASSWFAFRLFFGKCFCRTNSIQSDPASGPWRGGGAPLGWAALAVGSPPELEGQDPARGKVFLSGSYF